MKLRILYLLLLCTSTVFAQDLLSGLETGNETKDFSRATFKSTRLINFQTIEVVGPKTLDFRISHRFGTLNQGAYDAWGIDGPANIRLGLDYSYEGRFMFGFGRSSLDKMVDGYLKYRLLRQTTDNSMPLSVTLFTSAYRNGLRAGAGFDKNAPDYDRYSYVNQIIIGRKFSPSFSFQLAPFMVHYNLVDKITDKNDVYGVAFATRLKFTKRSAVTVEYAWRYDNDYSTDVTYYNSFSIGYELETGGHVFQVHLTNSFGIADNQFLARTTDSWSNNGIHLGFNICRFFTIPAGGGEKSGW